MRSELSDLLERGAERPSAEPDFADLARRGRRRRHTQQATTAMAVIAVIALTVGVVMPRLRQPDVVFDSGPRDGVGSWAPVPPSPLGSRTGARADADDTRVVVLGGEARAADGTQEFPRDGAVFDVEAQTWGLIPAAPVGEIGHMQLLDDGRLLVMQGDPVTAAFYNFAGGEWERTAGAPIPSRELEAVIWTGDQLLVWGGWTGTQARGDGAVWSPDGGWQKMAASPLQARSGFAWTWTGDRLLIWGGAAGDVAAGDTERVFHDGAAYDPATDSWTPLAQSPLAPRQSAEGVWTGSEWVVVGGHGATSVVEDAEELTVREIPPTESCDALGRCSSSAGVEMQLEPQFVKEYFTDGARYNPVTDTWSPIAAAPKGFRQAAGTAYGRVISYGARGYAEYDSAADTWATRPSPAVDAHISAWDAVAVGDRPVLVNSGPAVSMGDTNRPRRLGGVVYNHDTGQWESLEEANTAQRHGAVVAAIGSRVFVWGGASVTRDISQGYQGGDPWHRHDDGAVLTLD